MFYFYETGLRSFLVNETDRCRKPW